MKDQCTAEINKTEKTFNSMLAAWKKYRPIWTSLNIFRYVSLDMRPTRMYKNIYHAELSLEGMLREL